MIKFADIIRGKFLQEFSAISLPEVLVALGLSFALSLFILFVYRRTYGGVSYSSTFAACLVMLTMVTAVVILVISSNVVLSLGMVGALSIVRFRTAVKDAKDTAFLFWGIATGIMCGAGYITVSLLATVLLGLLFVGAHALGGSMKGRSDSYLLVARFEENPEFEVRVEDEIRSLPGFALKNKTMSGGATELVAQVRLGEKGMRQAESLRHLPGVTEITLMASTAASIL